MEMVTEEKLFSVSSEMHPDRRDKEITDRLLKTKLGVRSLEEAREVEFQKLMEEIDNSLKSVKDSDFDIVNNQAKANIKRVLGSHRALQLVILSLDNIQHCFIAKQHLALVLLLRDQSHLPIDEITVYATMLNEIETEALKALNCNPLPYDYLMKSEFDKPTLLFTPSPNLEILGELLKKNWRVSQLKKIIVFGVSLKDEARNSLDKISAMIKSKEKDDSNKANNYRISAMFKIQEKKDSNKANNYHPLPWIGEKNLRGLLQVAKGISIASKWLHREASLVTDHDTYARRLHYVCAILEHVVEFKLTDFSSNNGGKFVFKGFGWQFFDFNSVNVNAKKKKNKKTLSGLPVSISPWYTSNLDCFKVYDQKEEIELIKLWREMKFIVEELRVSKFYISLHRRLLQDDPKLRSEITLRLGSEERVIMVIYGLGSIKSSGRARFQLALTLLMREDIDMLNIGEIQVYDPKITAADARVINMLGCTVLTVNENCRRRIDKPTVFFTPFLCPFLVDKMLEANWCPLRLNKIVWLSDSYKNISYRHHPTQDVSHILTVKNYVTEFQISNTNPLMPFSGLKWHVFGVGPEVDLVALYKRRCRSYKSPTKKESESKEASEEAEGNIIA